MQATIVVAVLKFLVRYLLKRSGLVKKVEALIPGKLDDAALSFIAKLLGV